MRSQLFFTIIINNIERILLILHSAICKIMNSTERLDNLKLVDASDTILMQNILEKLSNIKNEVCDYAHDLQDIWIKSLDNDAEARYSAYSDERIQIYRKINEKLYVTEKKMKNDFERLSHYCRSLVDSGYIVDYEIAFEISFYLDENDPDYTNYDDNILAILIFRWKSEHEWNSLLSNDLNYNIFQNDSDHPLRNEHHCYLFHRLYDHTDLSWNDILRIGMVWFEIKTTFQNSYSLKEIY